jgi:hypothetical protein
MSERTVEIITQELKLAVANITTDITLAGKIEMLGKELRQLQLATAKVAYEAKSAERAEIVTELRKGIEDVITELMDRIVDATGGDYTIKYIMTPSEVDVSIMKLPKEGKTAGTTPKTGEKYGVSTKDLLEKYPQFMDEYEAAKLVDEEKQNGNAVYKVRQKMKKLDKGE